MSRIAFAGIVVLSVAAAAAQSPAGQGASPSGANSGTRSTPAPQAPGAAAHPRRAVAQISGFELSPQSASANQVGGAARGVGGATTAYAPHKGKVYSLRPSFQWKGNPSVSYKFTLSDIGQQTIFETSVTGASLTYPADAPALEPGKTYSWIVRPEIDMMGSASAPSLIVVIDDGERAKVEAALEAVQGTGPDAGRARAKVFFDNRLWYDSVEAYSALISSHPTPEFYLMRGSLYDQLPATRSLADADFDHAQ